MRRLLFPTVLAVAVYYAVFGGEHSLLDVRGARQARAVEAGELERLRAEIDSLGAWADSLESDSATLERLARERFGMIRNGEALYFFAEPEDTAGGGAR